jgi:hypothetical protein
MWMKEWSLAVTLAVVLSASAAAAQRGADQSLRRQVPSGSAPQTGVTPAPDVTVPSSGAAATTPGTVPPSDPAATALPATTLRMRGTISTYDPKGGILALSTPNGVVRFPVAAGTRVRHEGQAVDRAELKTLTGLRAAVRYSESGGHTTVESVNVFDTSERNPR